MWEHIAIYKVIGNTILFSVSQILSNLEGKITYSVVCNTNNLYAYTHLSLYPISYFIVMHCIIDNYVTIKP